MIVGARDNEVILLQPIESYSELMMAAGRRIEQERRSLGLREFCPRFVLPVLTESWRRFFAPLTMSFHRLGDYREVPLLLLNLMRDAGTRTVKSFAARTIVARVILHVRETEERIVLLMPSSGNKAMALREALGHAYSLRLCSPEMVRLVSILPSTSKGKVVGGPLFEDLTLRETNPLLLLTWLDFPSQVKDVAEELIVELAPVALASGWRLWNPSGVDNFRFGDCLRAFAENDVTVRGDPCMWRAQAVSSGYGVLGYDLGHRVLLDSSGGKIGGSCPRFLVVQHLAAPTIVASWLRTGKPDWAAPDYARSGIRFLVQEESPYYPSVTREVDQTVEPTLYADRPSTLEAVVSVLREHGGAGIVVSLEECLLYFTEVTSRLRRAGISVPTLGEIREWSTVLAFVGALLAIERGLLGTPRGVIVHGTGLYSRSTLPAVTESSLTFIGGVRELRERMEALLRA